MERWAGSTLGTLVNFLCVSVDSSAERTAQKFVRELNLSHSIVGYCGSRLEFPKFPAQLGCGGLVIFDETSRIVVPATQSLNQVGLPAFWSADRILEAMVREDDEDDEEDKVDRERRLYRDMGELRYDLVNGGARPCQIPGGPEPGRKNQNKKADAPASKPPPKGVESGSVPSVGHALMDSEHDSCLSLIRSVSMERTLPSLLAVLSEFSEHFSHEEDLLSSSGYGSDSPKGLSPLDTHKQDHERIIRELEGMVERARERGGKAGEDDGRIIMDLFESHATEFDARYTEYLATF